MTIQSIQVREDADGNYSFDFSLLERYVLLALECGMKHLEFSHMFTQWGAKCTPKIMVTLPDGTEVRRFGWDVEANDPRYREFLEALMPELGKFLQQKGWLDKAYFHISDEPYEKNLATYQFASELFRANLPGAKFIDALSKPEFYERGLVSIPVPANNHLQDFAHLDIPERWTYYCVSQYMKVPNQFMHMPSLQNRILGLLLYVYNIKGFLHWGLNFYNSAHSRYHINPYVTTSSDGAFPSGDPFILYPGQDTVFGCIRGQVFYEALQDMRICLALEALIGREAVVQMIDNAAGYTLRFDTYPQNPQYIEDLRAAMIEKIKSLQS
jgi:hypothetical protein